MTQSPAKPGLGDSSRDAQETAVTPGVREALEEVRSQLFGLCEATIDECHPIAERDKEGKPGAYARGRKVEAKAISRAMGEVFRDLLAALTAPVGEG